MAGSFDASQTEHNLIAQLLKPDCGLIFAEYINLPLLDISILPLMQDNGSKQCGENGGQNAGSAHHDDNYETQVLEKSIYKICDLLAVGFGDAGAEVIAENMKSQGDLDPMVPGQLTAGVFGFCDIRNFTDTTGERNAINARWSCH